MHGAAPAPGCGCLSETGCLDRQSRRDLRSFDLESLVMIARVLTSGKANSTKIVMNSWGNPAC